MKTKTNINNFKFDFFVLYNTLNRVKAREMK